MLDNEIFLNNSFIEQEKRFSIISKKLDEYFSKDIYTSSEPLSNYEENKKTIWIMWLQGMERAPRLIQRCYESIIRNKPSGFNVIVLDKDNLATYISLPKTIIQKYEKGIINRTHFSDIVRSELLYKYGGTWIDATVYCMDKIPLFMLEGDLFCFMIPSVITDPVIKMSSWWIHSSKNNRIFCALRNVLLNYWTYEDDLWDYFLFHIIFSKLVSEDATCSEIFKRVPYYNSGNAHVLHSKMALEYNEDEWNIIKFTSPIQKLSYKTRFLLGDIDSYNMHIVS